MCPAIVSGMVTQDLPVSYIGAHFLPVVLSNSPDVLQKLTLPSFCPSCAGDFLWSPATGSEQAGSIHRMIMDSTFILTSF